MTADREPPAIEITPLFEVLAIHGIPVKAAGVPLTLIARFVERFRKDENGCWIWIGQQKRQKTEGYGIFCYEGHVQAHRFSFFLFNGVWPGEDTHHTCERKPCVHPDHLQSLTRSEHKLAHSDARDTCLHGHPWIPENWILHKSGIKQCRLCHEITHAAFLAKAVETGHVPVPRKTHCLRGHELSPENVALGLLGERNCRICQRSRAAVIRKANPKPRKIRGPRPRGTKTHCTNGHEFTETNKYYPPKSPGLYKCLTCRNALNKSYVRKPKS